MGKAKNLQTGHIGLNVTDLDRSLAFYCEVFGFEVLAQGKEDGRRWAFLGRDERLVVTLWQQSEGAFATDRPGLHHLSFQVDTVEEVKDIEEVLRRLGAGFAYDGVVPHGENTSSGGIFFTDPDGTRLEIYAPTGANPAHAPTENAPTCGFF
ncbi:putative glyoxalase [Streptomyces ambofaciens ATCC 23877]|uniref:Putative glyoxalase n=1 Tax=Streptomyces ambofaciens (strain ATCC 23877 / 3486 / DSM 40053 / JCM 4204 / NBRC 12836 / NRRL B-2516) TaxID=278992 RepID=Q1RR77_STRA7|nr:VOC family protein [Streptomyces ambofaciens]AKZ53061.1 putative glyoxalase [Streptomyces ambofaciens ATCC 23877]AKZ60698.1 putative glyoxalase [Streptomyces ambofaciens ATCC 23877]CAI77937.1 putative glyoxalase [Streptomyces ambofaciens ATCC 23877]CAI78211.1 putative glyoxalase [Streptomyces ambofaciens ATCC 23877]CAJ87717.1 putative glyoxalase [Streptomyces ambofaciens ATCC 23877]